MTTGTSIFLIVIGAILRYAHLQDLGRDRPVERGRCDEWNRGTPDQARFEKEYLLAVGTRA